MAMKDLAFFQATGVNEPLYITYADREGTSPGTVTFTMRPQPTWSPRLINIVLQFNTFRYTLVDCKVLNVSEGNAGQDRVWNVQCQDRRWRWKWPRISGIYNKYLEDGSIWERTKKKPRELLKLLFDELKEKGFDTSKVPNDAFYNVEWQKAPVSNEIDALAERLGCRVCHMLNDTFAVLPIGEGTPPPVDKDVDSYITGVETEKGPDSIMVCFKRRSEVDVRLKAVCCEFDGEIVPLDKSTYKPTLGWNGEFPGEFSGAYERRNSRFEQELARMSVWRWFQIECIGKDGKPLKIPGYKGTPPTTLDEILPVFMEGVAYQADLPGEDYYNNRAQPTVWGLHCNGSIESRISLTTEANDPEKKAWEKEPSEIKGAIVQFIDYQLDTERGLFIFSEPIFAWSDPNNGGVGFYTPKLSARISVTLRDPKTLGEIFYEVKRDRQVNKSNTAPLVIMNDETTADFWMISGKEADNKKYVDKVAKHYLDQEEKEYVQSEPQTVTYNIWRAISMSGAITEVTWSLTPDGPQTIVSYNSRHQFQKQSWEADRLQKASRHAMNQTNVKRMSTASLIQQVNRQSQLMGR